MRINLSLSTTNENLETIDKMRGDIPRSRFILRLLETSMKTYKKIEPIERRMSVDDSFSSKDQQTSVVGV